MSNEERKNIIYKALKNKNQEKLKDLNVGEEEINEVENELNYKFPEDFKNFILGNKDLHIKPNLFKVNNKEKVLRYICSFDKNSIIYIGKSQNFDSEYKDSIIPFAVLEFGDTLCFDRETNVIVIYNHEEDSIEKVAKNWDEFYTILYDENK